MASSRDLASISAKPTTASLASVNGPSMISHLPLDAFTRGDGVSRPTVASSTPARVISSIKLPISAYISGLGGVISTLGSLLVINMNLIVVLLYFEFEHFVLYKYV